MPYVTIFGVPLNPGPFTVKEHVVITVMATVGSTSAYAVRIPFQRTGPSKAALSKAGTDVTDAHHL